MVAIDSEFTGVLCPLVTPLKNGDIDEKALGDLTEFILDGGVDGLFPCGSTSEFASFSPAQRQRIIEVVVEHTSEAPVIGVAAGTSVPETVERIKEVEQAGADAAGILAPYFHAPNESAGIEEYFLEVANQAALPLYLYNIPMHVGSEIPASVVERIGDHDRIHGMKDSSGDFAYSLAVDRQTDDDFVLFEGFDSLLTTGLRAGLNGGIHALANVIPAVFAEIIATDDTQRADQLQQEAVAPLLESCLEYGIVPATKVALVHRGVIPSADVKPPLVSLDDSAVREVENRVDRAMAIATENYNG